MANGMGGFQRWATDRSWPTRRATICGVLDAPNAAAARTTAPPTAPARSSAPSNSPSTSVTTSTSTRRSRRPSRGRSCGPCDAASPRRGNGRSAGHPATGQQTPRPRPGGHSSRRPVGVHDVPRVRGAVPGAHLVRRQDRRHAKKPRHGQGRVPPRTRSPFQGMESNGNPWNLPRADRVGLGRRARYPHHGDRPTAPVLFWVGCAASYDDRAKRIARATAKLLKQAGVDFAILGRRRAAPGTPHGARATSFSSRCSPRATRDDQRIQGSGGSEDRRHDVPALLQHAEERVSRTSA